MELIIHSKKYGSHTVYFDEEDAMEISKHIWHIRKDRHTFYCEANIITGNKRNTLKMHSLIMKPGVGFMVDHRDGDGLNNQRDNLRICNSAQNQLNRGKQKNNTSGFKGVKWDSTSKKWQAYIGINRTRIHGGLFVDKLEAARRYNELAIEHHGEFANLNIIP